VNTDAPFAETSNCASAKPHLVNRSIIGGSLVL